jgi:hypothetical protein
VEFEFKTNCRVKPEVAENKVRKSWRARRDSNPRPSASKADTLSS